MQVLSISPDIFEAWQSLGRDQPLGNRPPAFAPDAPHLVWRLGFDVKLRQLEADEADALAAATDGASFAAICEKLCEHIGMDRAAHRAAELLDRWVSAGMIGRIEFTPTMSG